MVTGYKKNKMKLFGYMLIIGIAGMPFISCSNTESSARINGKWRGCDPDSVRCYWFDFNSYENSVKIIVWQVDNGQVIEGSYTMLPPLEGEGEEMIVRFPPMIRSDTIIYQEAQSYLLCDISDSLIQLYLPINGQVYSAPIRLVPRL